MYNIIKAVGTTLGIKEQSFQYRCTYMWAVLSLVCFIGAMSYFNYLAITKSSSKYDIIYFLDVGVLVFVAIILDDEYRWLDKALKRWCKRIN